MLKIELLAKHHDRKAFDCGNEPLNRFLQQLASQQAGMTVNQYAVSRLFPQPPKQAPTLYDMAMNYEGVDVSEIELEPTPKLPSKNRFMELD